MADPDAVQRAFGPNDWLVDDMYEQYVADPSSVSESWREFFADYVKSGGNGRPDTSVTAPVEAPAAPAPAAPAPAAPEAAAAPARPSGEPEREQAKEPELLRGAAARIVAN